MPCRSPVAAADPLRFDTTPAAVVATGRQLLATMVEGLPPRQTTPARRLVSLVPSITEALARRVPEEQFNVQSRMYGQYHVTQPLTWFNNTDRWTVPEAQTNEQSLPSEALNSARLRPSSRPTDRSSCSGQGLPRVMSRFIFRVWKSR